MPPKKKMIDSKEMTCNNGSKQPTLFRDVIQSILKLLSFVDFRRARRVSSVRYSASKSCIGRITNPWLVLLPNNNRSCKFPTLPLDVVRIILERLNFADFHRARCVSSVWYSASKSCNGGTNPTNPWLILFPKKNETKISCKLFDPRDHKTYLLRDLGFDFARCLASSGSWLLMLNSGINIFLLNLFTRERIRLPSLETYGRIPQKAILWVDEKSRDYLVVLNYDYDSLAYNNRGDNTNSWKVFRPLIPIGFVYDLVFRESKLYVLRSSSFVITPNIIVFDISSRGDDNNDSPKVCASFPPPVFYHRKQYNMNLAVTLSGEILIIASDVEQCPTVCLFNVYKMDTKSSKWSIIKHIGDEVLILDLGITVPAKDGGMRNCIYFGKNPQFNRIFERSLSNDDNCICIYHIRTDKVCQWFRRLPVPFKDARWFLPTFVGKCLL